MQLYEAGGLAPNAIKYDANVKIPGSEISWDVYWLTTNGKKDLTFVAHVEGELLLSSEIFSPSMDALAFVNYASENSFFDGDEIVSVSLGVRRNGDVSDLRIDDLCIEVDAL